MGASGEKGKVVEKGVAVRRGVSFWVQGGSVGKGLVRVHSP